MKQYRVTGMSCAACSARVEKAVKGVAGVSSCEVNLLTGTLRCAGGEEEAVLAAVRAAGYGISPVGAPRAAAPVETEGHRLRVCLFTSLGFLAVLMYLSMGAVMWGAPLPAFLAENPLALGMAQALLSGILLVINRRFFVSGVRAVWHRSPNMDTLVALGSGVSYLYSLAVLFGMSAELVAGELQAAAHGLHGLYFESAGMILTLITLGKMLEARAKGKTTDAIRALLALAPETARVEREGREVLLPVSEVARGDVFILRPGDRVPVDGRVLFGESALDEAALTGESLPVDKSAGDTVYAATVNTSGHLRCEATGVGEDTALSRIVRMVSDAAAGKAPIAKLADRVSAVFVPVVLAIAAVTVAVWLLCGAELGYALGRGISVLVISCPCALGLATPVAIMVGSGVGARRGILFKTAAALEETGRVKVAVFDKTGTLTEGRPQVTDILPVRVSEDKLLCLAASLEAGSEHPLARAVCRMAEARGLATVPVEEFRAHAGSGVSALLDDEELVGGRADFVAARVSLPEEARRAGERLAEEGKTPIYFGLDGRYLGLLALRDTLREDSLHAVRRLRQMGIHTVMLTGDGARAARAVAARVGVDEVIAGVLPEGKANAVQALTARGKVVMVGDGINDAPALVCADVGMAIGAGTDVAIDAADVVLTANRPYDVVTALSLGRATLRNIRQNLFWAFFYNCIGIPLAAGVFVPLLGWTLSPMIGAAAMSLSSVTVVSNALRLNLARLPSLTARAVEDTLGHTVSDTPTPTAPTAPTDGEEEALLLSVSGMMCGHCEAHVKEALEAVPGVRCATADHKSGTVLVRLSAPTELAALRAAVQAAGYTVE